MKNKQSGPASIRFDARRAGQDGFIEIIVIIIVALLLMKYFGITISGVLHWFSSFFSSVLK